MLTYLCCPLPLSLALALVIMLRLPSPFSSLHSLEIQSAFVPVGATHGKRSWLSRIEKASLSQRLSSKLGYKGFGDREQQLPCHLLTRLPAPVVGTRDDLRAPQLRYAWQAGEN
jgi:hypothetical protein